MDFALRTLLSDGPVLGNISHEYQLTLLSQVDEGGTFWNTNSREWHHEIELRR
jgi:hypothetical protein